MHPTVSLEALPINGNLQIGIYHGYIEHIMARAKHRDITHNPEQLRNNKKRPLT